MPGKLDGVQAGNGVHETELASSKSSPYFWESDFQAGMNIFGQM